MGDFSPILWPSGFHQIQFNFSKYFCGQELDLFEIIILLKFNKNMLFSSKCFQSLFFAGTNTRTPQIKTLRTQIWSSLSGTPVKMRVSGFILLNYKNNLQIFKKIQVSQLVDLLVFALIPISRKTLSKIT
jgi:hypothetical protein